MKRIASLVLALFLCLANFQAGADTAGKITYSGGDGLSFKTAIVVLGAANDEENTRAEYAYLGKHFPNYLFIQQALLSDNNKSFDLLEFKAADGTSHKIYFDITAYLGKL